MNDRKENSGKGKKGQKGKPRKKEKVIPKEVIDHLKLREGWRNKVYKDTRGFPTAGLGHKLSKEEKEKYKVGATVPKEVLEGWAKKDARKAYDAALDQAKKLGVKDKKFIVILTSVNFQLGTGWYKIHKKTWAFMLAKQWEKAAAEAEDSKWFKQTPVRVRDFQKALKDLNKPKPEEKETEKGEDH